MAGLLSMWKMLSASPAYAPPLQLAPAVSDVERELQACAERATRPRKTNLDPISNTTRELLETTLRLDANASHTERKKESQTNGKSREPFFKRKTKGLANTPEVLPDVFADRSQKLAGNTVRPLFFVDYKKAFDSVETKATLSALVDQGVDASYVRTLANCYDRCTTAKQLFHRPLTICIGKGVRQGDTIMPKVLQWIMKSLSWGEGGLCNHLFDSTALQAFCYAVETSGRHTATSRKLLTTHRALERYLLKFNRRTQHLASLRSSDLKGMSRLRDPAEYILKAKHR
ncbi:hypothetical protein RB195_023473 [Necator americanus]|uniref:Reverse transcriptase domain-containing protein n=1 Tax=Necator americanus TaxID=51031 RepID=A0ABR1ELT5_NECAM